MESLLLILYTGGIGWCFYQFGRLTEQDRHADVCWGTDDSWGANLNKTRRLRSVSPPPSEGPSPTDEAFRHFPPKW